MNKSHYNEMVELYQNYTNVVKPLIAVVESKYESFPWQIFNEIRSFTHHIALCYEKEFNKSSISIELRKAREHINRTMFDCFKFLNVYYHDYAKNFERSFRNVDLTVIDNGDFYRKYMELRQNAINAVKEAKRSEVKNMEYTQQAFDKYQEAYNIYTDLEELILTSVSKTNWARMKFYAIKGSKIIIWISSVIVSALIANILANSQIMDLIRIIKTIFGSKYP